MKLQEAVRNGYGMEQDANNVQVELKRENEIFEKNINQARGNWFNT